MQDYFNRIADRITANLADGEVYTCSFSAEDSDFVRFNHNQIRQAGSVAQRSLTIDLIKGRRHASSSLSLSIDFDQDAARVGETVKSLREKLGQLPEDPHLLYATEVHSTEFRNPNRLPDPAAAVADIQKAGRGRDLVGIYAAGAIHAGFANSFGQRNWYTNHTFNFDWSFYHQTDKAVKTTYAGFEWTPAEFDRKVSWPVEQLDAIARPARTIPPGRYRVYLGPAALREIIHMLCWGGFGLKAHRTKETPLLKLIEGKARLSPAVTILENTREGTAPNFQEAGFIKPEQVALIKGGVLGEALVSPRSAKEYGVATNGASEGEAPESVDVSAGDVPIRDVLKRLDTGVYVNSLWYLNYSDRSACRMTGMTRFATYWVEHGAIEGPLNVMRFDETIYRMLGENLLGLTAEREMLLSSESYGQRSTSSARLPGVLVGDLIFTL
jgi:predicted Zn-dependent protease